MLGLDECGYGSCAGAVTVTGCIIDDKFKTAYRLRDSKLLSPNQITEAAKFAREKAYWFHLTEYDAVDIDLFGLGRCWDLAVLEILHRAPNLAHMPGGYCRVDRAIIDGSKLIRHPNWKVTAINQADSKFYAVQAAAVIGKESRDRNMKTWADKKYPQYGFRKHVGYGTADHFKAVKLHGPCELHRFTYSCFKQFGGRRYQMEASATLLRGWMKEVGMASQKHPFLYSPTELEHITDIGKKLEYHQPVSAHSVSYLKRLRDRIERFV